MSKTSIERTFTFVDLAGFSALTETHGDGEAAGVIDRFTALVERRLGPSDRLVKTIGDAVMLVSESAETAVDLVGGVFGDCQNEPGFPVPRAGMHRGPAVERGDDYIGGAVNLAARITARAAGGEVLCTAVIAEAARRRGIGPVDLGEVSLRNISEPVRLFGLPINPRPEASAVDPVCRMKVERSTAAGRLVYEGSEYYFCSLRCAGLFASDPARYGRS